MDIDATLFAWLVPLVTVLVRVIRAIPALADPSRSWALPLISIGVGLGLAGLAQLVWPPAGLTAGAIAGRIALHGLLAGLAASGLWSAAVQYVPGLKTT